MSNQFRTFFRAATGFDALPYQVRLALADHFPATLSVPTGLGKTAAAVLSWLWRRSSDATRAQTARRLVYCLPTRTLVEQTREAVSAWLEALERLAADPDDPGADKVVLASLMGGEPDGGWDIHPERVAILVGTQDMLLSRLQHAPPAVLIEEREARLFELLEVAVDRAQTALFLDLRVYRGDSETRPRRLERSENHPLAHDLSAAHRTLRCERGSQPVRWGSRAGATLPGGRDSDDGYVSQVATSLNVTRAVDETSTGPAN